MRCGACLAHPPPFVGAVAAIAYAYPADRLIQRLKYGGRLALAVPLADLLAASVLDRLPSQPLPDALVPVPLSAPRQRGRGFNQAAEIARAASARLGRPVLHALERHRDAPAQATLSRRRRVANVRGAFRCVEPVRGLSLALVDDVMTTGATLAAAATALNQGGATRVAAWAVARTLSVH
jgi:ComF family protein